MKIAFVCTGNTCRSAMAEYLFKDLLKDFDISIESAGVFAFSGDKMNGNAQKVLKEKYSIENFGEHRAKMFTEDMLEEVNFVFTMAQSHKNSIFEIIGSENENCKKVFTLTEYIDEKNNFDIIDPFGHSLEFYEKTSLEIYELLLKLKDKLEALI